MSWHTYLWTPNPDLVPSLRNINCANVENHEPGAGNKTQQEIQLCAIYIKYHYWQLFQPKWAPAEVAEGLMVIAGLIVVASVKWPIPEELRRQRRPPQGRIRTILKIAVILGLAYFAFAGVMDLVCANYSLPYLMPYFNDGLLPVGAGVGLLGGALAFGLLRLDEGILSACQWSVWLASYSTVFFLSGLVGFDFKELELFIARFSMNWRLFGVPVLSNLFVLMVSTFLLEWSITVKLREQRPVT